MQKIQENIADRHSESLSHKKLKNPKSKSALSFSGHRVVTDNTGIESYRFYLPPDIQSDGKNVKLQLVKLIKDEKGNYGILDNEEGINEITFDKNRNYVDDKQFRRELKTGTDLALGYKFVVNGKDYFDNTLLTNDRKWNIAVHPSRPLLEQAHSMYHVMPDLMITKGKMEEDPVLPNAKRTHSNKMGGNIDGIIEKIDYMDNLGIKRLLVTPLIGQDNRSSHGYWTTNPYQITESLGDVSKFKKLNVELFKKGMGLIEDGAFVNEGHEGIHLESVIRHGKTSPYLYWFTTYNFTDQALDLGVLSKKANINSTNISLKLINAPYSVHIGADGNESVEVNRNYNKDKSTYVQLYDKRLASLEQKNDPAKEIDSYENKNPEDQHEINDYMDTVVPYKLRIDPAEVEKTHKFWKERQAQDMKVTFSDMLYQWDNFRFVNSADAGGHMLWVGNRDISKLRFMVTGQDKEKINNDPITIEKVENAACQVQDHIIQVGEFWTAETAKTIHQHTAKQFGKEVDEAFSNLIAEKYGKPLNQVKYMNFKKALEKDENKKLIHTEEFEILRDKLKETLDKKVKDKEIPQVAGEINKEIITNILLGRYDVKSSPAPKTIEEGIMAYPLDAIEFHPQVCGVLGSPFLKKLASKEEDVGKSRYEFYLQNQENGYSAIPKEYRKTYQQMDNLLAGKLRRKTHEILEKVDEHREKTGQPKLFGANQKTGQMELTEDGRELYGLVSNDIAKFVLTQSILNSASLNDPNVLPPGKMAPDYSEKNFLKYDTKILKLVNLQTLNLEDKTPELEAEMVLKHINKGVLYVSGHQLDSFVEHLNGRLDGLNAEKVKLAKVIVDKSESGLEWRIDAAKDVCPIEEIKDDKADFESSWSKGINFWKKFTDGVRKHNPKAYEILEITDEGPLVGAAINNKQKVELYTDAHEANLKLIQGSGATTPTNYNYFYSWPHELFSTNTEKWADKSDKDISKDLTEKLIHGWQMGKTDHAYGHLLSNSLDGTLQSHNSIGNHDKPRASHGFGLDMPIFFQDANGLKDWYGKDDSSISGEDSWKIGARKVKKHAQFFYGETPDFSKADGKAMAMGIAIRESLEKSTTFKKMDDNQKKDINQALKNLVNGKYTKADGTEGSFNPLYFGVKPYDINLRDIVEEAKRISIKTSSGLNKPKDKNKENELTQLKNETLAHMIEPAMKKYRAAMGLLVAMPGNPTIYAGDELAETGFELKFKNPYLQNRNLIHYFRLDKKKPDYIQKIADGQKEIKKIMDIRKDKDCAPLVNGSTVVLNTKKDDIAGVYRYNDNTDMFVLLNKKGYGMTREQTGPKTEAEKAKIANIDLSTEFQLNESGGGSEAKAGILANLADGAVFKNALDKKNPAIYKIETQNGVKTLQKYDKQGGSAVPIVMDETDLFLYRVKEPNPQQQKAAFTGNPNVRLANTKYHISFS